MEIKDLAADPKHKATMDRLCVRLLEKQKELGDTLNVLAELPGSK